MDSENTWERLSILVLQEYIDQRVVYINDLKSESESIYGNLCLWWKKSLIHQEIINAELAQLARAQPCQGWGRGFESRTPLHFR